MKNKSAVIFDFDGTLFDSRIGIINGVKHAAQFLGLELPSSEVLTSFIGPPLGKSFQKHFGLTKEGSMVAIAKLREYYGDKGIFESEAYDGIEDLLIALNKSNRKVAVATAKPTVYANQILEKHNWSKYFGSVKGSSMKGELFPKKRTITEAMNELIVLERSHAVMIGDTIYDIKGAQEVGIESIAVNYGFGKNQDLKDARPTRIVNTVQELSGLLL